MERVLTELTPECEITARMYAQGYEKKEIASMKCRAISTINNQLQMAFTPIGRAVVACCLLCVFSLSLYHEQGDMRRSRRSRVEQIERIRRLET